jgi:hypothetical protein
LDGKVNLVGAAVIVDREQGYKCSIPVESKFKRSDFEEFPVQEERPNKSMRWMDGCDGNSK